METNLLAYYEKRVKEYETDPMGQMDYMLKAAPYIQEFYSLDKEARPDENFPLAIRTNVQEQELFKRFMIEVEEDDSYKEIEKVHADVCRRCGSTDMVTHSTALMVCARCATTYETLGEELTYKEEQEIEKNIVYSYKRENHFNEWISQFQGNERTTIGTEIIEKLRYELKKQKVKDVKDITHPKVRALLKKLRLNKFYEHVPYITTILNGLTPPKMSNSLEEKLRLMFAEIQAPFEKHCPTERKNFLSYSYTLYKFCELLGEDEYLPCFPLLKSKEKLKQQDSIWKDICKELKWEYIPTI